MSASPKTRSLTHSLHVNCDSLPQAEQKKTLGRKGVGTEEVAAKEGSSKDLKSFESEEEKNEARLRGLEKELRAKKAGERKKERIVETQKSVTVSDTIVVLMIQLILSTARFWLDI